MIVSCPQCATRYRLTEAQLAGRRRVRLRCTQCGVRFVPHIAGAGFAGDTVAVDAVITGSNSVVPEASGGLPMFGGMSRDLQESGSVPAVAGEVPRPAPAAAPLATGMLPARPSLAGSMQAIGAQAPAGPGLPRFGSGALPTFGGVPGVAPSLPASGVPVGGVPLGTVPASAGPSSRSVSGALPAFGGARISVPQPGAHSAALPVFGAAPAPIANTGAFGAAPWPVAQTAITRPNDSIAPRTAPAPDPFAESSTSAFLQAPSRRLEAQFGGDMFSAIAGAGTPDNDLPTRVVDLDTLEPSRKRGPGSDTRPTPRVGGIDPILEFQNVFRDAGVRSSGGQIQRFIHASKDGNIDGSELVAPPEGFSGRSGLLDIALSKSTEKPLAPVVASPQSNVTEESALLDLALLASGLSEPAPPEPVPDPETVERARLIGLDVAGDAARRDAALGAGRTNPWLVTACAVLVGMLAFFAFVATRNNGVLNFGAFDQAFAVAFGGDASGRASAAVTTATPRLTGEPAVALAAGDVVRAQLLQITDVSTSRYTTRAGQPVVVVAAAVANSTQSSLRAIEVVVVLRNNEDEVVDSRRVPVGGEFTELEIESLASIPLESLYATLRGRTSSVVIEPGQQTRFSALFVVPAELGDGELSWDILPLAALQPGADGAAWAPVMFEQPDAASEGSQPAP